MTPHELSDLRRQKQDIRTQARITRRKQSHKDIVSQLICAKFAGLPEYGSAQTILFYIHVRSEVRTQDFLQTSLSDGKRVVVPYCVGRELKLFPLERMNDLAEGSWQILEPKPELRVREDKEVDVTALDLVMVPGVAFDVHGGRMGHGKGYYERLLERVPEEVPFVALAFECQMFSHIPMEPDDVYMDKIITEKAVYEGRGRCEEGG